MGEVVTIPYKRLPDTPWHVGCPKKDEDDPRRHKARCIKNYRGKCLYNMGKCIGSAHCDFYAETEDEWAEVLRRKKSVDQETTDRIKKYKEGLEKTIREFQKSFDRPMQYVEAKNILTCPVCGSAIKAEKNAYKCTCAYCKAVFCDEKYATGMKNVIIVGRKRPNTNAPEKSKTSTANKKVFIVKGVPPAIKKKNNDN